MPTYKNRRLLDLQAGKLDALMTYEEFSKLWKKIPDVRFRNVFTLLFFTGLRPEELRSITTARMYKQNNQLIISIKTAKLKKEKWRNIPLSLKYPEVKALWEWAQSVPHGYYIAPLVMRKYAKDWVRYRLKKYGINLPPYFFRHNHATLLAHKGVPIRKIAALRGTSEAVTEEAYRHVFHEDLSDTATVF